MANSVAIPQDIIYNIIEAVGDDHDLLKRCALVSSFLLPSRKHLFSKVSITYDEACQRLYQLLVKNPVIQSFVKSITITGFIGYLILFKSPSLTAILRLPFCCPESLYIGSSWLPSNWNDFSNELKDALSTIILSSTLKTLYLNGVNMPIMLFHGIHLTKLDLRSFWLNDFDAEQLRLLTLAASDGVTTRTPHSVVDRCVWNFHEPVYKDLTEPMFLPFMCRLRVFEIRVNPSSANMRDFTILSLLMRSLRVSLTSPVTLEHIKFDIAFEDNRSHLNFYAFFNDLRNDDVWRHLDSIIIHPTGSRLQRVDINIEYPFCWDRDAVEPNETEVIQPVLDALPLLRKKGILFIKAHIHES